jgi:hypothetical protein
MPDFERLTDSLRSELATSPEERAYANGYKTGKAIARLQVAVIAGVAAVTFATLRMYLA